MGTNKKKSGASSERAGSNAAGDKKKEGVDNANKMEDKGRQKQKLQYSWRRPKVERHFRACGLLRHKDSLEPSGVKVSVANNFIRSLESKGVVI